MLKRMYVGVLRFFLSPLIEAQDNSRKSVRESDLAWEDLRHKMTKGAVEGIDDRVSELEERTKKHEKHIDGLATRLGLFVLGDGFVGQSAIDQRSGGQKLNEALEQMDGGTIIDILRTELAHRNTESEAQTGDV